MVLLRRVIGDALRARRQGQHRTLREVSTAANVSLGYLSEIERGQKEASSELLAAICEALGARLSEVLGEVSGTLALAEGMTGVFVPVEHTPAQSTGSTSAADTQAASGARAAGAAQGASEGQAASAAGAASSARATSSAGAASSARATSSAGAASSARATSSAGAASSARATSSARAAAGAQAAAAAKAAAAGAQAVAAGARVKQQAKEAAPVRQVTTDGGVSVSVRQDTPLKATLRTRRKRERDVVCAA
ncbi:hypothetical protein GCM10010166_29170 [Couchioplanes caeruleus subsp. azureus]|nr:hypothetical protein GCM10010166_29170 [Couchioplanes caeruleus subsp. azureus]